MPQDASIVYFSESQAAVYPPLQAPDRAFVSTDKTFQTRLDVLASEFDRQPVVRTQLPRAAR